LAGLWASIASAGSRTSSKTSSPVTDARSDHLFFISGADAPGRSISTTNPRIASPPSSSTLAQTMATSATGEFVIHILAPCSTQPSAVRRARVTMPPGLDPWSGSVRPKQPMSSPAASFGRYFCFCSSLPYFQMGNITSEPCTEAAERKPESPRSSSIMATP